MQTTRCITRQTVLPGRDITLCERHDDDDAAVLALGLPRPIGSVQHSWHEDYCDACRRAQAEDAAR